MSGARDVLACLYRWRAGAPELLMLRRAPDRGDFWHWLSGAPLPGESDRDAAIREVLEETRLDVAATIFPLGYRYAYPLRSERAARWLELCGRGVTRIPVETFAAETPARWEPRLDEDHNAYAWCTFGEVERRLSWPAIRARLTTSAPRSPFCDARCSKTEGLPARGRPGRSWCGASGAAGARTGLPRPSRESTAFCLLRRSFHFGHRTDSPARAVDRG